MTSPPAPGRDRPALPDRRVPPLSWIAGERIAIGARPAAAAIAALAADGITHVVNCRSRAQVLWSGELAAERAAFGADHVRHAPMWDLGRPQPPRLWADAAWFAAQALADDPNARARP